MVEPTARWRDGTEMFTSVVPMLVGDDWQAALLWKALYDAGVYTNVALYPAVPRGRAMSAHERDGDARDSTSTELLRFSAGLAGSALIP